MITANDIKTRGVKAIEEGLTNSEEVGITVRGKLKYVVVSVEKYDEMRTAEIKAAYADVMKDIENGDYTDSLDDHFNELDKAIKNEA